MSRPLPRFPRIRPSGAAATPSASTSSATTAPPACNHLRPPETIMLLTKKPQSGAAPSRAHDDAVRSPFVHSLQRGLSRALPTMDRRAFLRRSGLGVGVGIAAGSLSLVKKARAADNSRETGVGTGKIEVRRTVCSHCSVGCAVDAVVENGVWVRQEPVFDSPINLGAHC